jgi:hypothetical protein
MFAGRPYRTGIGQWRGAGYLHDARARNLTEAGR